MSCWGANLGFSHAGVTLRQDPTTQESLWKPESADLFMVWKQCMLAIFHSFFKKQIWLERRIYYSVYLWALFRLQTFVYFPIWKFLVLSICLFLLKKGGGEGGAEDVVRMPSQAPYNPVWWCFQFPALKKQRQENQKTQVIFSYTMRLGPNRAKQDSLPKTHIRLLSQPWQYRLVKFQLLGRMKEEDHKFSAYLGYKMSSNLA